MAFADSKEADVRLTGNPAPLTEQDVRDLMPWIRQISEGGMRRLSAELALQNLGAVQKFERSSSRLTVWLIALTAALVLLTIVIAWYTVQLTRHTLRTDPSRSFSTGTDLPYW